eukprot:6854103-Prymnesium_polylepis.1
MLGGCSAAPADDTGSGGSACRMRPARGNSDDAPGACGRLRAATGRVGDDEAAEAAAPKEAVEAGAAATGAAATGAADSG